MGNAAELELVSTGRSNVLPDNGMRTIWQLGGGMSVAPTLDRRALAASLHRLLDGWRAAERQVAELVDDRESASPPETSILLDAIARYRAEHKRIFDAIQALAIVDERSGAESDDDEWAAEVH